MIERIRALVKEAPSRQGTIEINETILEIVGLTHSEVVKSGVSARTQLAEDLPFVEGDRVQLQQVIPNLVVNAAEAMSQADQGQRELLITTATAEPNCVLVEVRACGPGIDSATLSQMFDAFYTTKPGGFGMGLPIWPMNQRGSWRAAVGDRQCASRRGFSNHVALRTSPAHITVAHCLQKSSTDPHPTAMRSPSP